jgi:hypothetical protein
MDIQLAKATLEFLQGGDGLLRLWQPELIDPFVPALANKVQITEYGRQLTFDGRPGAGRSRALQGQQWHQDVSSWLI